MKQVIKFKGNKKPVKEEDRLVYKDETLPCIKHTVWSQYECYVTYIFSDNKLISENYVSATKDIKNLDFVQDYNDIKYELIRMYGQPHREEISQTNLDPDEDNSFETIEELVLSKNGEVITRWPLNIQLHQAKTTSNPLFLMQCLMTVWHHQETKEKRCFPGST